MKSFFKLSLLIVVLLNSNVFSMDNSFLFRPLTMYKGNPTSLGTCTITTEEDEEGNPLEDGGNSRPAVRINQQGSAQKRKWYDGAYYLLGNKKLGLLFGTTFDLEGVMLPNSQPGNFRECRRYYITPWGITWLTAGAATIAGAAYFAYNYLRN